VFAFARELSRAPVFSLVSPPFSLRCVQLEVAHRPTCHGSKYRLCNFLGWKYYRCHLPVFAFTRELSRAPVFSPGFPPFSLRYVQLEVAPAAQPVPGLHVSTLQGGNDLGSTLQGESDLALALHGRKRFG
jgi:hypothetical protein